MNIFSKIASLCIINAVGNAVPPMFIFTRVNFKDIFMEGALAGSIGFANPRGWMNADIFFKAHGGQTKHGDK